LSLLNSALAACVIATLVHHAHNAQFLDDYPNMPASLSPALVYLAWLAATAVAFTGYWAVRAGHRIAGGLVLLAYGAYSIDGLMHYTRAPLAAHTPAMNTTIFFEALTGGFLMLVVLWTVFSSRSAR
jgi:hypothetical protein